MNDMNDMNDMNETSGLAGLVTEERLQKVKHINLQLAALEQPIFQDQSDNDYLGIAEDLIRNYRQQKRLLADYRCPVDQRIQDFLNQYLRDNGIEQSVSLPGTSFVLDRPGLARELSLPANGNDFSSQYVKSYRLIQGILNNPGSDRRTTKGVFHIVEGGLPVPEGKKAVPVNAFLALFERAMNPPDDVMRLPFTSTQNEQARIWVSLLLRPTVSPEVPGVSAAKSLEVRFFAPGSLVSNLDFVERIFGNGGDPCLPENDAGLDIHAWTGHSGCVILAPHLLKCRARELGLPHYDQATERQRRDGMFWRNEDDLYNDGQAFKITCRDMRGVVVTIIADNYYGYSKKEVKSQTSYSANLLGGCEEEHSGGALAYPCYNLGDIFQPDARIRMDGHNYHDLLETFSDYMHVKEEGYGVDRQYPDIIYIPEDTHINLLEQTVSWERDGICHQIKLLANHTYIYPCGYKVRMEKHPRSPTWRLIGAEAEGTFCHKPCTVSGGGKSEISKSISPTIISGPLYVGDIHEDLDHVEQIFKKDYSDRFRDGELNTDSRSFLSNDRSLGSSIRLLMPSRVEYTEEYNAWLATIPQHIRALAFIIKRFYRQEWEGDWRKHFTVDVINGHPGHELKYDDRKLVMNYLRVGKDTRGSWRIYKLRQDYIGADKVQTEDDITVSTTIASTNLNNLNPDYTQNSVKLAINCEQKLFQRPDDAIHRGLDTQAEEDLSGDDTFISNFEPLEQDFAIELIEGSIDFCKFTDNMQGLIRRAAQSETGIYFVSSAHPRIVDGRPTLNVRYLQNRPDLVNARDKYIAEMGVRLYRRIPPRKPVHMPVNAILAGRRNNPGNPQKKIRPLAVYNPIHYQDLPELFMDYISSLTGKSPSTTGAGSEGALTKGPFNSLPFTADLNNALVSYILTAYDGFSSAAGYVGPECQVEHDISLLIPEIWCRIPVGQRSAAYMIDNGYLEKLDDFEYEGEQIHASRLGYRITSEFVHAYMGKIFDNPDIVFDEAMLKPETQDLEAFVDGVCNIVEAQQRVAQGYINDGSVNNACPPLKALIYIMAQGHYEGKGIDDPDIRNMFTMEYLLNSDWYQQRLLIEQQRNIRLWERHAAYVEATLSSEHGVSDSEQTALKNKRGEIEKQLQYLRSIEYLHSLQGSIGADWIDLAQQ